MVKLEVYKNHKDTKVKIYDIEIFNKINLIMGKSGEGKSFLCSILDRIQKGNKIYSYICKDSYGNSIKVELMTALDQYDNRDETNKLIIMDEEVVANLRGTPRLNRLLKMKSYFILLDRDSKIKLDVNVQAAFRFRDKIINGTRKFKLEPIIGLKRSNISEENINKIKNLITEDTGTGELFWSTLFPKLKLLKYDKFGNGGICDNLIKAMLEEGDTLVALDYDYGAVMMQQILKETRIDLSRVHFIPLESLEEVICNSEFILSKHPEMRELVLNYKDHITALDKSTGSYFNMLLYKYVKAESPVKQPGDRNYTKFYEKNMKNFIECFLTDCCTYDKQDCTMKYDGDKLMSLLSNKFEQFNVLR